MHVCRFPHPPSSFPTALRERLESIAYAWFIGGAAGSVAQGSVAEPPVADTLERSVYSLLALTNFGTQTAGNGDLSEWAAHRLVQWCEEQWSLLHDNPPYAADERLRAAVGPPSTAAVPTVVAHVSAEFPELAARWQWYGRRYGAAVAMAERPPQAPAAIAVQRAVAAALWREWRTAAEQRRAAMERRFLQRAISAFIDRFNRDIAAAADREQRIIDVFGVSAGLWDREPGDWQRVGAPNLERTAADLRQNPSIQAFARWIGRAEGLDEDRRWEVVSSERHGATVLEEGDGKAEIVGIRRSGDIGALVACELVQLAVPDLLPLFTQSVLEQRLLTYRYRDRRRRVQVHTRHESHRVPAADRHGPMILCIDTSGSMAGGPERMAKAVGLAFVQAAIATQRAAYVIAFSTAIRCIEISNRAFGVAEFVDFLSFSFHAGTDLSPAIREAVTVIDRNERFARGDVVIVSDFRIPKMLDRFDATLRTIRRRHGTRFHALTIRREPVLDWFNLFDSTWHVVPENRSIAQLDHTAVLIQSDGTPRG